MPCIVFAYFALASFVVHATQDCQGNDCPVKVNSLLQVHGSAQIEVEAPYSKSTTNACTMGFQRILSEDECRTAANALGFSYKKVQTWPEHAPGCLKWDGDGPNVYYNDHETGRTDGASNATMAICKEANIYELATQLNNQGSAGQGYGYDASGKGVDACKGQSKSPSECEAGCSASQYCTGYTTFDSTHSTEPNVCALHMGNDWRSSLGGPETCPTGFSDTKNANRGTNNVASANFDAGGAPLTTYTKMQATTTTTTA